VDMTLNEKVGHRKHRIRDNRQKAGPPSTARQNMSPVTVVSTFRSGVLTNRENTAKSPHNQNTHPKFAAVFAAVYGSASQGIKKSGVIS